MTPPQTPQANAYVEPFMGEVRSVLNNFILIDHCQVRHICKTVADHHNRHRSHQGIGILFPVATIIPIFPQN